MHGKSKLFAAHGPVVNEKSTYYAVGAGDYLANFLTSRMQTKILKPYQAMLLAAFTLFQCKKHVDGCGGGSHIAALLENGESAMVDPGLVDFATEQGKMVDSLVREFLLAIPDFSLKPEQFETELAMLGGDMTALTGC